MSKLRIGMEIIRTAAALIAATALVLHSPHASAQSRLPGPHSFEEKTVATLMDIHFQGFLEACALLKMKCRDIAPPRVGYAILLNQYGSFDVGSRTVLIDLRIFSQEVSLPIVIHESIHYLQDKRNPLRGSLITIEEHCADEKEAHELTLAWTVQTKIAKGDVRIRTWDDAKKNYGCP